MYTTVTKVRQASGFVGNTNITDAFITQHIKRAESKVISKISDVYALPLPKYYEQAITFSGTGSGSATMTITINSANYTVAVTNGLSASSAADLFRTSALNNTSFVTDGLGSGATVTFWNYGQDGDSTDVTITSTNPQTVSGITATGGTVTEVAVPIIEYLTTGIANATLLINEYGPESQDTDKDGFKLLALFDDILKSIANKEEKVFDFAQNELPGTTTKRLVFSPNDTTNDDDTEPTASKFTMNKTF